MDLTYDERLGNLTREARESVYSYAEEATQRGNFPDYTTALRTVLDEWYPPKRTRRET